MVGLGHTGAALAERARALGMTVLATKRHPAPHPAAHEVLPPRGARCAAAAGRRGQPARAAHARDTALLDARRLALLPAGAIVFNAARGPILDEAALVDALDRGHLAGAWLDVFATEPLPPDDRLWTHARMLITPHCADQVHDWPLRFAQRFVENWARRARGEALLGVVVPRAAKPCSRRTARERARPSTRRS